GADRGVGGAHVDDARLAPQRFLERARRSILRQGLASFAAIRLAGRERRRAVRMNDVEDRRHSYRFRLAVGKLQRVLRGYVLDPHSKNLIRLGRYLTGEKQQRREHGYLQSSLRHGSPPSLRLVSASLLKRGTTFAFAPVNAGCSPPRQRRIAGWERAVRRLGERSSPCSPAHPPS